MRTKVVCVLMLALAGCAGQVSEFEEEYGDPIDGDGRLLEVTMPETEGILRVANTASFEELDIDARLDRRAAQNIVDRRGSGFETIEALDAVPYVGEVALGRLLDYAYATDQVEEGPALVHGIEEGSAEALGVLAVANELTFAELDDDVGLDRRAAQRIVDGRGAGLESLEALDAVGYVGARAFDRLLAYAYDNGYVGDDEPDPDPDPDPNAVVFEGPEQCTGTGHGGSYAFTVISNPLRATTDMRLVVQARSSSPYGPRPFDVQIELGPSSWQTIATTRPAGPSGTTQSFTVPMATVNEAIDGMGWIRLRVDPGTAYESCSTVELFYNCPSCLACPAGEEDVGFGCEPISSTYENVLLDHPTGMCGRARYDLFYDSTPAARGDGQFSMQYALCDGGSARVELYTTNVGWVEVGNANTALSCGYADASFTIPEAYLDAARDASGRIRIRYTLRDGCASGVGCAGAADECVRRASLSYQRE